MHMRTPHGGISHSYEGGIQTNDSRSDNEQADRSWGVKKEKEGVEVHTHL